MTTQLENAMASLRSALPDGSNDHGHVVVESDAVREVLAALYTPPADDVREALDHLDVMNESGRIAYADYVALHDMVSRIEVRPRGTVTENAREAEMRELHHFEVEQQLAETIAIVKRAQAAVLKHEHTPASLHMDAILDEVNTEIPSGAEVRPRGTVTDALYCAHCQNDDHASSACEARGTVTAPGLRCPACGWSTSNREAEQHVCPGPSYATALRAIANGDGPRFVREFARDTLEAEPQVRPRGAVTDAPRVLADPKGGCACEPFDQDAGGGHIEHLLEYEPDCPVHSTHLYDPRIGQWIMREKFEAARGGVRS